MKKLLYIFGILLFLSMESFAQVQISFTGTVTSTNKINEVKAEDAVSGSFVIDLNAVDEMPADPISGLYQGGAMDLKINEFQFSAVESNVSVINNGVFIQGEPPVDAYEVVSPLRDVTGPSLSGLPPVQIDLVVIDTDATVFSDDSQPSSLEVNEFEITSEEPFGTTGGRLIFQSLASGELGEIRFRIDSFSASEVNLCDDVILYPQLAIGGGYEVVLIITNTSDTAWSGRLEPLSSDQSLDAVRTTVALNGKETKKFNLTGGADTVTSGLKIQGDEGQPTSSLAVSYFFEFRENGNLIDSTGVPPGQAGRSFSFPVEKSDAVNTGLAIRRLLCQGVSSLQITLFDSMGSQLEEIETGSDFSQFFTELFSTLPDEFLGWITVESENDFYLVVVRLETIGTGFQLTSIPAKVN